MMGIKRVRVRSFEKGLYFKAGEFVGLLEKGKHWLVSPFARQTVNVVSMRDPWFFHEKLDLIVKSGALEGHALVMDLNDHQRGLVWVDGRFDSILAPGLHVLWTGQREIRVETIDARTVRFEHTRR